MIDEHLPTSPYETNRESYLSRLPQGDVANLMHLVQNITDGLANKGKRNVIMVVGGSINKPLPRKDIDMKLLLDNDERDSHMTPYKESCRKYSKLQGIMRDAISDGYFRIEEETPPAIDEEFNSESILKFTGVIKIQAVHGGTPIEIINEQDGIDTFRTNETRPFVVLAESK